MSALRSWVVTVLAFTATATGATPGLFRPTVVASTLALVGVWASVSGNEVAIRLGRRRFIFAVMLASMCMASVIGFAGSLSYTLAIALCLVYGMLIWGDSSSLTAGAAGSALPGQRGATLAVHSTMGYAGGFFGPLAVGVVLDLAGGASALGYGLAFAHVAVVLLVGPLALLILRPAGLPGDRGHRAGPSTLGR
jgi:MFS family permease